MGACSPGAPFRGLLANYGKRMTLQGRVLGPCCQVACRDTSWDTSAGSELPRREPGSKPTAGKARGPVGPGPGPLKLLGFEGQCPPVPVTLGESRQPSALQAPPWEPGWAVTLPPMFSVRTSSAARDTGGWKEGDRGYSCRWLPVAAMAHGREPGSCQQQCSCPPWLRAVGVQGCVLGEPHRVPASSRPLGFGGSNLSVSSQGDTSCWV